MSSMASLSSSSFLFSRLSRFGSSCPAVDSAPGEGSGSSSPAVDSAPGEGSGSSTFTTRVSSLLEQDGHSLIVKHKNSVVDPHWSQSGSGSSFLPKPDLDPNPGSKTHADTNFHVNVDPDPDWYQNNADPRADYPKFYTC
jgi:hypothetical protein